MPVSEGQSLWRGRKKDASQRLHLTFPPMEVELPRWSPDGKRIAFMGLKSPRDRWQTYVVPFEGWFGVTPDDSFLVSAVPNRTEIYALDWEAP